MKARFSRKKQKAQITDLEGVLKPLQTLVSRKGCMFEGHYNRIFLHTLRSLAQVCRTIQQKFFDWLYFFMPCSRGNSSHDSSATLQVVTSKQSLMRHMRKHTKEGSNVHAPAPSRPKPRPSTPSKSPVYDQNGEEIFPCKICDRWVVEVFMGVLVSLLLPVGVICLLWVWVFALVDCVDCCWICVC